eukprot:TRINITY_DN13705_c0_g2_i1.p1 TRINITY_DN13705_c0_g2~~TRINITY_DN13705_c0_g2_i1.p1  ORF type:complete len:142 (+),score=34.66 TRINITY_DN13705_c0_g2_i1:168-593(+)
MDGGVPARIKELKEVQQALVIRGLCYSTCSSWLVVGEGGGWSVARWGRVEGNVWWRLAYGGGSSGGGFGSGSNNCGSYGCGNTGGFGSGSGGCGSSSCGTSSNCGSLAQLLGGCGGSGSGARRPQNSRSRGSYNSKGRTQG